MSRQEKITHLFSLKEESAIESVLGPSKDNSSTPTSERSQVRNLEETGRLRQEILRLQHVIRELEQQLNGQISKPTNSAENGLLRISECNKDIEQLLGSSQDIIQPQWLICGHKFLDSLESSLGKLHNITSDFRYRFKYAQEPLSQEFRALLIAAKQCIQQRAAEEHRARENVSRLIAAGNTRPPDEPVF